MSSKRYIEIVSTHRNRVDYPFIADFVAPISGISACSHTFQASDPVALASPIYIFQKGSLNHDGQVNGGNYVNPALDATIPQPYVPSGTGNGMYRAYVTPNAFNGYMFIDKFTVSGTSDTGSTGTNRLIVGYDPLAGSEVALDVPELYTQYTTSDYYTVADYSGINSQTGSNFPNYTPIYDFSTRFCPQPFDLFDRSCPVRSDAFVGNYLKIEPNNPLSTYSGQESRKIISFDPQQRLLLIDSPFTENSGSDINVNDVISVREGLSSPVINVNGKALNAYLIGDSPAVIGNATIKTLGATSIANGGSNYKGHYLFIVPRSTDPVLSVNYPYVDDTLTKQAPYFFRIVAYNADNTFILDKDIILSNYTGSTLDGRNIEILQVNQDNFSPIEYNGSIVSQNETVCYEMELTSLTLPNVPLVSGSRIAFYPYVYVLLENYTIASGSVKGIFYSNNPPTHKALFVAPVTDTNDPLNTPFVRIDGFGINQTIKFKPNDALHFKVFLPDGSLFQPIRQDNPPPLPPDRILQIRAVFGIKRL